MVRTKRLILLSLMAALSFVSGAAEAKKPRDYFFHPQKPGTRLKLFPFFGPGFRATLENRAQLEPDMSELHTQLIGDVNPGYAEASLNADVRVFLFVFGASVGVRRDYHILKFEPDTLDASRCTPPTEPCLDHGKGELDREARWLKDLDQDWKMANWPWAEGRFRLIMPMYQFMGISTLSVRYQHRGFDNAYDWPLSTVFDDGTIAFWETFLVVRDRHVGFVGPALRVLYVPRGGEYEIDWHYGLLAGTQAGPGNHDLILLRVYTTLGTNLVEDIWRENPESDDLMGTHAFRAPIQVVFGYQMDFEL